MPVFQKIFNPDNALMITMAQITDCIFLSLMWLMGCIPVVTLGTSTAALYDAVVHAYRRGDKHAWQRFIKVYKENFKSGILPALVFLAAFAVAGRVLILVWNGAVGGRLSWMLFSAASFVGMLVLGLISIIFPMLSRFENSFGNLLKNSFLVGMVNLPRTLALGLLNAGTIFLCARYIFPIFFMPALSALLGSLLLEPMFRPYMPPEEEKPPLS